MNELNRFGRNLWMAMIIATVILIFVWALSTLGFFQIRPLKPIKQCCDNVCPRLGPNVSCYSVDRSGIIKCRMNYARYKIPEIDEIFEFKVTDLQECLQPRTIINKSANGVKNNAE